MANAPILNKVTLGIWALLLLIWKVLGRVNRFGAGRKSGNWICSDCGR
jgi:hypothetical protein